MKICFDVTDEDTIPLENIQEQLRNKLALLKKQL